MSDWVNYYYTPQSTRTRVLNVISLEFSSTPLEKEVKAPTFVREMDWFKMWPKKKYMNNVWPRIQNYCLMSAANSYTDFHIDLGGSSVW